MSGTVLSRRGFLGNVGGAYLATAMVSGAAVGSAVIADPLLHLINAYKRCSADCYENGTDAYANQHLVPLQKALFRDPPRTTSVKGAAEALRLILDQDDIEDGDAAVIRRVLEFLEAQTA